MDSLFRKNAVTARLKFGQLHTPNLRRSNKARLWLLVVVAAVAAQVVLLLCVRISGTTTVHGSAFPRCTSAESVATQGGVVVEVLAGKETFVVEGSPLYRVAFARDQRLGSAEVVRAHCAGVVNLLVPQGAHFGAGHRLAVVEDSRRPLVVTVVNSAYLIDLVGDTSIAASRAPRTIRVGTLTLGARLVALAPFALESGSGVSPALQNAKLFRVAFELVESTAPEITVGAPIAFDVSLRPRTLAEWIFG
jgi:hypothetical protein